MENWMIVLVVQILLGALVVILGFFMKRAISQIDERLKDGDERFKELSATLSEFRERRGLDREYFAKEYVSKDDFIRDIRALDFKVEQVAKDVKKLLVLTGGKGDQHANI